MLRAAKPGRRPAPRLYDFAPKAASFREEVLKGLRQPHKELPCKFFYDERGSQLFDQICTLDEYYPTRTELGIMREHAGDMAELLGPRCLLVEYGSGSSTKTRLVLDHVEHLAGYVPIDISKEHLMCSATALAQEYEGLNVLPVCADYTAKFELPKPATRPARRAVYFPGSTIGNFHPAEAGRFLRHIAEVCGPGGALLIGVDLRKNPDLLHRAYNDREQVTAAFNLNVLARINRELGADFQLDQFRHYAFYNPTAGRIEMHLVSLQDQSALIGGVAVGFERGESIWTESSYKYTLQDFARLAAAAGFGVERVWTDADQLFSVQYLVAA